MTIHTAELVPELRSLMKSLCDDLLERSKDPQVGAGLQVAYNRERKASRTADPFDVWRRGRTTQIAAAWILSVLFVRTLEDRLFIDRRRIAGPGARDSEELFVSIAPFLSPRDYLLTIFRELSHLPGATDLFDVRHNPVWILGPSAEGARSLIDFFRTENDDGSLHWDFAGTDSRFLGDIYQDLDEEVRSKFALLQTPDFVEDFILEETLTPAIRTFGLSQVKLIDPTCGSGHFLLGAFQRLFAAWQEEAPGTDPQVLAQRALSQVHGADLNPYAVAIARFRLTLAFLQTAQIHKLQHSPLLQLNLCVADSLLHGVTGEQGRLSMLVAPTDRKTWGDQMFALEDEDEALRILSQRYQAVVGNPPYITEKDRARRELYRKMYTAAAGKFALAAPFTERFFGLAVDAGYIGMINANSFMKREFGKKLIEKVLPQVELTHVVDASGAYIPGHGTPTVLLFGRNQQPNHTPVLTVMGKQGEPSTPEDPTKGKVWSSIQKHHREVGFENDYISVAELERERFAKHPWSLGGGGAAGLKEYLENNASKRMGGYADIGVLGMTNADDCMLLERSVGIRRGIEDVYLRPLAIGEEIRDWTNIPEVFAIYPYDWPDKLLEENSKPGLFCYLWPFRTSMGARATFDGGTYKTSKLPWWKWHQVAFQRLRTPLSIAFAFVATHNHFVLDRGGKVFKQTAPIIKLAEEASEEDHLALLGYLNSSTMAFWGRQSFQSRGSGKIGEGGRIARIEWDNYLEYAGTLLGKLPVPDLDNARDTLLGFVRQIEATTARMTEEHPRQTLKAQLSRQEVTGGELRDFEQKAENRLQELWLTLVSLQEEIDWRVYGLFGFPTVTASSLDQVNIPLNPALRPFEIRLGKLVEQDAGARIWFERHKRNPIDTVQGPLAELYQQRLDLIEKHKHLQLFEAPENKRRWSPHDWQNEFREVEKNWLLERIERYLQGSQDTPQSITVREIAFSLQAEPAVQAVAEVYSGESDPNLERLFAELIGREAVPYLAALRYKESGLEKRRAWEETWELQRREDAGEEMDVPVPPKYKQGDFLKGEYWRNRGKLDVAKERFVSYPGAELEEDPSLLIGWAGWDHLEQAQALSALYQRRKDEDGWEKEKLIPLLAGLWELVPWLQQWHNEPDETFGGLRLGDFFEGFVHEEAQNYSLTVADLQKWRPPVNSRRRRKKR